uniref:PCNA-interacting partner n=1 Tax=Cyprinus carpio carpio TaxID=630221 RepID=A0A9J7XL92_CYPCA
MVVMGESLRTMTRVFRRECHRVLDSERTTIQGADGMLMVLQLAMAGINKQIQRVVRRVFCSYLGLLVKSKNDMALAFTLDNPNRSLGHIAFTDLSNINKLSFAYICSTTHLFNHNVNAN